MPACAIKDYFTTQRSPGEQGPSPFEGPSSYPQLCWWLLIWRVFSQGLIGLFVAANVGRQRWRTGPGDTY